MYHTFFGLQSRPFAAAPSSGRYFPASSIEQAREALCHAVDGAQGPGLVIGAPGTGKSTLCTVLAEHYRSRYRVAMLASNRLCSRRALLQNILFELGLPYRDLEEGELRLSLIDHLEPRPQCRHGMLMVVDEAQSLPARLLEELRMITNLVRDGEPRVRLILAGNSSFEERLANPRLESLSQRIAARCYLHPMNGDETAAYVRHQIQHAGGHADEIFQPAAMTAIFQASNGIPRLVNQVCDHALMLAAMGQTAQIGEAGIQEAWSDLQQLPVPWSDDTETAERDILEFGPLDDSEDETHDESPAGADDPDPGRELDELEMRIARIDDADRDTAGTASADDQSGLSPPERARRVEARAASESFTPDFGSRPEVELTFHPAHNPFGEPFEEEEVVVDPYAAIRHDGTIMAMPAATDGAATTAEAGWSSAGVDYAWVEGFNPASDPVMPDPAGIVAMSQVPVDGAVPPRPETAAAGTPPPLTDDDRDMILVDDGELAEVPTDAASGPHRHRYRQLFATLRKS